MNIPLQQKTLALAKAYQGSVKDLTEATGLKRRWFDLYRTEKINEPSVLKVQKLHDYLTQ